MSLQPPLLAFLHLKKLHLIKICLLATFNSGIFFSLRHIFLLIFLGLEEFNFWSDSPSFCTHNSCSSFKSESSFCDAFTLSWAITFSDISSWRQSVKVSTFEFDTESFDRSVWISARESFNSVFSSAFSHESMLSDMALNSFSLFELLIDEDSIWLATKTQEPGKIKSVFSNILRSSVFVFAVKDDFILKRVFIFLHKTFSSITLLKVYTFNRIHVVISMYNYF